MMNLLELANKEESTTKLTLIFLGIYDYMIDEYDFFSKWALKVKELMDRGNKVDLIYSSYNVSDFFITGHHF